MTDYRDFFSVLLFNEFLNTPLFRNADSRLFMPFTNDQILSIEEQPVQLPDGTIRENCTLVKNTIVDLPFRNTSVAMYDSPSNTFIVTTLQNKNYTANQTDNFSINGNVISLDDRSVNNLNATYNPFPTMGNSIVGDIILPETQLRLDNIAPQRVQPRNPNGISCSRLINSNAAPRSINDSYVGGSRVAINLKAPRSDRFYPKRQVNSSLNYPYRNIRNGDQTDGSFLNNSGYSITPINTAAPLNVPQQQQNTSSNVFFTNAANAVPQSTNASTSQESNENFEPYNTFLNNLAFNTNTTINPTDLPRARFTIQGNILFPERNVVPVNFNVNQYVIRGTNMNNSLPLTIEKVRIGNETFYNIRQGNYQKTSINTTSMLRILKTYSMVL